MPEAEAGTSEELGTHAGGNVEKGVKNGGTDAGVGAFVVLEFGEGARKDVAPR